MSVFAKRGLYAAALAAVAACTIASPAMAGGGADCQQKTTRLDVEGNPDGAITAAKHAADADKRFDMMDADKDGRITAAEIGASHGAESAAWAKHRMSAAEKIRKLDADDDGALTRAEYAAGSQKMFTRLDADGDGNLTASEMHAGL